MNTVVRVADVSKTFEQEGVAPVRAVIGLNLQVKQGEIFALVGPDGAGKTTTIRMMCGLLKPDHGSIEIMGVDMAAQRDEIKHHIGYLSQRFSLYPDLTVDENIDFFAEIHRIQDFLARKEELLAFTRLTPFRTRLADQLSGGMKQKLALACTLIHTPDVIFLDEPTTGVDPVSRRDFWKILSDVLKQGITVVMSTPYLDEAERSTRVALLNRGEMITCDKPEKIRDQFTRSVVEIQCDDPRHAAAQLRQLAGLQSVQLFGNRVHVVLQEGITSKALARGLKTLGVDAQSMKQIRPSLEDVFMSESANS
ncbi:MAG: ABC transporter ATP-binding protein [Ignavibacteria bacterium]|nr:ABC transporter ATP-binding protein [Ignavibacteria bacterium]